MTIATFVAGDVRDATLRRCPDRADRCLGDSREQGPENRANGNGRTSRFRLPGCRNGQERTDDLDGKGGGHGRPRRRDLVDSFGSRGDVPREPQDGDALGKSREDLGNPDSRWSPTVPCERDPTLPRARRRDRPHLRTYCARNGDLFVRGRDRRRSGDLALFRRALCQLSYPAVFVGPPRGAAVRPASRSRPPTCAGGFGRVSKKRGPDGI